MQVEPLKLFPPLISAAVTLIFVGVLDGGGNDCAPDRSAETGLGLLLWAGIVIAGLGLVLGVRAAVTRRELRGWVPTLLISVGCFAVWFLYYGGACSA